MKTSEIISRAVMAKRQLSLLDTEKKNRALMAMADSIEDNIDYILSQNNKDMEAAKGKISDVKLDRLLLTEDRIKGMAEGIRDVVKLPDPVGRIITEPTRAGPMSHRMPRLCALRVEMYASLEGERKLMPPRTPS